MLTNIIQYKSWTIHSVLSWMLPDVWSLNNEKQDYNTPLYDPMMCGMQFVCISETRWVHYFSTSIFIHIVSFDIDML